MEQAERDLIDRYQWWECLHPIEKSVMVVCEIASRDMIGFMLKATYDAVWAATGEEVGNARYVALLAWNNLYLQEIENPEGGTIEIYRFDDLWWLFLRAYLEIPTPPRPSDCFEMIYSAV